MDNFDNKDEKDDSEEFELGHADKLVGVFASPTETFEKISNYPPKALDWFIPVLVFAIVVIFAQYVKMSNPTINFEVMQKQKAAQEKRIEDALKSGQITQEQAEQQREMVDSAMNNPIFKVIGGVIGIIALFIIFFIMVCIYHFVVKLICGGAGTFAYSLVSYGLVYYILVIQAVFATLISLLTSRLLNDVSLASFLGMAKDTPLGLVLSFVEPVSIWFNIVLGIALAKTFKAQNSRNYIITVFGIWIVLGLLFYALAKNVPFLSFLNGQ